MPAPVRIMIDCSDSDVRACVMGLLVHSIEQHRLNLVVKPFEKQMEIVQAARADAPGAVEHIRQQAGQIILSELIPLDPSFTTHSKGFSAGHKMQVDAGMVGAVNGENPFLAAGLTQEHYAEMTDILTHAHEETLEAHDGQLDDDTARRICQVASARLQHYLEQKLPTLSVNVHAEYFKVDEGEYRFMIAALPERGDSNGQNQD